MPGEEVHGGANRGRSQGGARRSELLSHRVSGKYTIMCPWICPGTIHIASDFLESVQAFTHIL